MSRGRTVENIKLFESNQKFCKLCKDIKTLDQFFNNKCTADKLSHYCKYCCVVKNKLQYQKNKKEFNCEKCGIQIKKGKLCSLHSKEHRREYRKSYETENRKNIEYRIKNNISRSVREMLTLGDFNRKNWRSIRKFLPYTMQELKTHLEQQFEPWMSWENYGIYIKSEWDDSNSATWTWQIDHITPHSTFNYSSMEDEVFKVCWSLENLRPLSSKQNIKDGARRKLDNLE